MRIRIVCHFPITTSIDSSRNTKNIKIAVENANLYGKNMRYAHFAAMCEKCGNIQKMRQYAKYLTIAYLHKADMPT